MSSLADRVEQAILQDEGVSLVRSNCSNLIQPRRLMKMVDADLKYWGYKYHSEVLREYAQSTGIKSVMGNILKRNIKPETVNNPSFVPFGTSERFERIHSAVNKMPLNYKELLHRHYVINKEKENHRNDEPIKLYVRRMGYKLRTYEHHLKLSKECFTAFHGN